MEAHTALDDHPDDFVGAIFDRDRGELESVAVADSSFEPDIPEGSIVIFGRSKEPGVPLNWMNSMTPSEAATRLAIVSEPVYLEALIQRAIVQLGGDANADSVERALKLTPEYDRRLDNIQTWRGVLRAVIQAQLDVLVETA